MKITSKNPNFLVGSKTGLRLETKDGTIVEFFRGDGLRVVNINDVPHVEFSIDKKPIAVKIESRQQFFDLLGKLRHTSEYRTQQVDLMEALTGQDFSTAQIVEAFGQVAAEQAGHARVNIPVTKRVTKLSTEQKVAAMAKETAGLKNPEVKRLSKVGEASYLETPDPALPGSKPADLSADVKSDEEDGPKLGYEPVDASAKDKLSSQSAAPDNSVAESEDDDDDDKKDKDAKGESEEDDDDDKDDKKEGRRGRKAKKEADNKGDMEPDEEDEEDDDKSKKDERRNRRSHREGDGEADPANPDKPHGATDDDHPGDKGVTKNENRRRSALAGAWK